MARVLFDFESCEIFLDSKAVDEKKIGRLKFRKLNPEFFEIKNFFSSVIKNMKYDRRILLIFCRRQKMIEAFIISLLTNNS